MNKNLTIEYFDNPYDFYQNHTEANIDNDIDYRPEYDLDRGIKDYLVNLIRKEYYEKLPSGIIHQKIYFNKIKDYNLDYSADYNKYGELGRNLGFLRLGFLISSIGKIPESILDVGYGNGDFLKAASKAIKNCYGTDITQGSLPDSVKYLNWEQTTKEKYDVITFFDSLEHFEDIEFVKNLKCDYIFITLPWCHYKSVL